MTARTPAKNGSMHDLHKRHSQHNVIAVQTETVATQTDATGNPGTGGKKKKKKKKKKKSEVASELASERASENGLDDDDGHSDSDDEVVTVHVRGTRSNSAEVEIERQYAATAALPEAPPGSNDKDAVLNLPLSVRLEKAAGHADLKAGLTGLVEWSDMHLSPDVVALFFQSKALPRLLENVFATCPTQAPIYDKLTTLFANVLVGSFPFEETAHVSPGALAAARRKTTSSSVEAARVIVASIRATVDSLRALKRYKAANVTALVPHVAASLTSLIVNHQTLHVAKDAAADLTALDEQLARLAASEHAGQTIRDAFHRRDVRSDAVSVSARKLDALLARVVETRAAKEAHVAATPEMTAVGDATSTVPPLALDGSDIASRLALLREKKRDELAPLQAKKGKFSTELADLRRQQEELRTLLANVESRIVILSHVQDDVAGEMAAIAHTYDADVAALGAEDGDVVAALQHTEKKQEIVGTFRDLRTTLDDLASAAVRHKVQTSTHAHIDGLLRYVSAQAICVQFMKNRVVDNESKRAMLSPDEPEVAELSSVIDADYAVLRDLRARDTAVQADFAKLLTTLEAQQDDVTWHADSVAEIHSLLAKVFAVYDACASGLASAPPASTGKDLKDSLSLSTLQGDEQLTMENLARLEQGKRPTPSPRHWP